MNSSGAHTTALEQRQQPSIGIIGGSGMCSFPELTERYRIQPATRYGLPSDEISVCEYAGVAVAFLPRHGRDHTIAPHKVPYKANLAALKELGVRYVLATCIVGSLKKEISPGSLVVPDQFVNLTWGRDDYIEADENSFMHLPMGDPYCRSMREAISKNARRVTDAVVSDGTVAVIQGPRFSTRAESQWLSRNGWDIVNMTQYPECYLARELGLCYGVLASVTDYDVGLQEDLTIDPERMDAVLQIFRDNVQKTKKTLLDFIVSSAQELSCSCSHKMVRAYYEE